jgi:hypothetical protein
MLIDQGKSSTQDEVRAAWQAELANPANGRKASKRSIAHAFNLPESTVSGILSRESELFPGRPQALTKNDKDKLLHLYSTGALSNDRNYLAQLALSGGSSASMTSVRRFFNEDLQSKYKKFEIVEADKYTEVNWLKLQEYMQCLREGSEA